MGSLVSGSVDCRPFGALVAHCSWLLGSRWQRPRLGKLLRGRGSPSAGAVVVILALTLAALPQWALAEPLGPLSPLPGFYVVQPGDTLASIASDHGVDALTLAHANGLRSPRRIYPGQVLAVTIPASRRGGVRELLAGECLADVARAADMDPYDLALANGLLRPTALPVGIALWLPESVPQISLYPPRLPTVVAGESAAPGSLPVPVVSLTLSANPVPRGETLAVSVQTSEPVGCSLSYLDRTEVCLGDADPGVAWLGLVGLPALLEPGVVTLTLTLTTPSGDVPVYVPVVVEPGRYDYERIDLPPDRQSLLDPTLSRWERDTIAEMRLRRSADRHWQFPFVRPLDAAITSYYGSRRSYGYGFGSYHAGADFDGEGGEPVLAPADGVVILAEKLVVRGNAILVDHGWGVVSGFWHLSQIGVGVGDVISQGQVIGKLGNTGLSTGAHLHWELWVNGTSVNALSWLDPDGPGASAPQP